MKLYKLRIVFNNSNIDLECDLKTVNTIRVGLIKQTLISVSKYLIDSRKISYLKLQDWEGNAINFNSIIESDEVEVNG